MPIPSDQALPPLLQRFITKWNAIFADNEYQHITEGTFRALVLEQCYALGQADPFTVPTAAVGTDTTQVASTAFVQAAIGAAGKGLSELVLPMMVRSGLWYVTAQGIWEARRNFSAAAAPAPGANWRAVVSFASDFAALTGDPLDNPSLAAELDNLLPAPRRPDGVRQAALPLRLGPDLYLTQTPAGPVIGVTNGDELVTEIRLDNQTDGYGVLYSFYGWLLESDNYAGFADEEDRAIIRKDYLARYVAQALAQHGGYTDEQAIAANAPALAGKEAAGVAATLDAALAGALRDGVSSDGDTLQKLYNLLQLRAKQYNVATLAARNALSVKIGDWVNVDDDGDGRWAIYRATSAGANAAYNKVSDPDLLNAVMSAAQIKAAYEGNANTNAFTNALLAKLNGIAAGATAYTDLLAQQATAGALGGKVDKVPGKGLSSTDYTQPEKDKLGALLPLAAGTNVAFDTTTTPGQRIINVSVPAAGVTAAQLETVRTTLPASATQTGAYTLAAADAGNVVPLNAAGALTLTIPADANLALPVGTVLSLSQEGAGAVTVAGASGVTVTGLGGLKTPGQYGEIGLRKVAANAWRVTGGVA